jgi:hypothetical protein
MAKKPMRVAITCETSHTFRWMKRMVAQYSPPVGSVDAEGVFTVHRPDKFKQLLQASECRITETLAGARRRR